VEGAHPALKEREVKESFRSETQVGGLGGKKNLK